MRSSAGGVVERDHRPDGGEHVGRRQPREGEQPASETVGREVGIGEHDRIRMAHRVEVREQVPGEDRMDCSQQAAAVSPEIGS